MPSIRARMAVLPLGLLLALTGCSGPGPLTTLLDEPQTAADRIDPEVFPDIDDGSTRLLAEHDGHRYWVGSQRDFGRLCLVVFSVGDDAIGAASCGTPPIQLGWNARKAMLLPDGMPTDGGPGDVAGDGWTIVTPNLVVRE